MSHASGPSLDPLRFPQRKTIRLKGLDYSSGIYFITICVWNRRPLLSRVTRGRICLTSAGRIVRDEWLGTNQIRRDAWVDAFAIMPDHGRFVAGFKSACTRRYRELTRDPAGALWRRGCYEHVIRSQRALLAIRCYIGNNPGNSRRQNDCGAPCTAPPIAPTNGRPGSLLQNPPGRTRKRSAQRRATDC